jgi:hypothetical protein
MTSSMDQPGLSVVFADRDRNYYLIPVEVFERGRVPAERKAVVEQAQREHDVTGHGVPLVIGLAVGAAVVGAVAADAIWDAAMSNGVQPCYEKPKPRSEGVPLP